MAIKSGTRLGRYEVRSPLGTGGRGEVYLAEDTKLDRKVALKVLPPDVASKQERMARFVREAKAAAALNHPNIAHVYEIDEVDGQHFIAMEYYIRYFSYSRDGRQLALARGNITRDAVLIIDEK